MADALCLQVQRAPKRLRRRTLAGVRREMQTLFRSARINPCKPLRRPGAFIAANAKRNYVSIAKLNCQIKHALILLRAKLPDRVKNPQHRHAEIFLSALKAEFQPFEYGCANLL